MKKLIQLLFSFLLFSFQSSHAFELDTLQYKGSTNNYLNFVIMGDGYTTAEQDKFVTDAANLYNYVFSQPPWSNYINHFNVFAIKVVSVETGATHPNTAADCNSASPPVPVSSPNTYLGCTFDVFDIHRLIQPTKIANVVQILSTTIPNYDAVFILSNSPYYGGSGGTYSTVTTDPNSNEVSAHEIGHSFGNLGDEYYAGDAFFSEKPNMTMESDTSLIKWKNWLGYNGVDVFQYCCGGNSGLWHKPHTNCKMQYLGYPYCSVCTAAIIEKVHSMTNPVVSYSPNTPVINSPNQFIYFKLTELMTPVPNTLSIEWKLDGNLIYTNVDSIQIDQSPLQGMHTLTAKIVDTTLLVRVNNHSTLHVSTVTWTINKTNTGINLISNDNKISYSIYPNPVNSVLNISLDLDKKSKFSYQIISAEGKIVAQLKNELLNSGEYLNTLNIEKLVTGTYKILFKLNDVIYSETFIKL